MGGWANQNREREKQEQKALETDRERERDREGDSTRATKDDTGNKGEKEKSLLFTYKI